MTMVRCTCRYPEGIYRIATYPATGSRKFSYDPRSPVARARTALGTGKLDDPNTRDC